jgi:catechol 2,3-dioxygenase-like lactoylglutathione lyase family enzyme
VVLAAASWNPSSKAQEVLGLEPVQFRVARPTDRLEEVRRFYCDALGLEEIGSFRDHAGYDGVMLGVPERDFHLEFTTHIEGSPCPAPSRDNLLVFYLANRAAVDEVAARMRAHGHVPVTSENPYWSDKGLTFEDPDGWRVVFVDREASI